MRISEPLVGGKKNANSGDKRGLEFHILIEILQAFVSKYKVDIRFHFDILCLYFFTYIHTKSNREFQQSVQKYRAHEHQRKLCCAPQLEVLHLFFFSLPRCIFPGHKEVQSCERKKPDDLVCDFYAVLWAANFF